MDPTIALLSILGTIAVGAMSPGPSFVLVVRTSAALSRRDGLAAALGMGIGGLSFALLALAGLQALLMQVSWLYLVLKLAGATYLMVPFVSEAPLLGLMAFLLGIGLGCAQPLTIILTYNHAPPGRSGEALGMRLTVNKLTQIAVPLAFGALGSAFGLLPVFFAIGAFLLAGGIISLAEGKVAAARAIEEEDDP